MKKQVLISIDVEGFHNYPNAPLEVDFLKSNHRHTFKIICTYDVKDMDREKEIFIQRAEVSRYIRMKFGNPAQFKNMSCEMIAMDILNANKHDLMVCCEVWEESTGGGRVSI